MASSRSTPVSLEEIKQLQANLLEEAPTIVDSYRTQAGQDRLLKKSMPPIIPTSVDTDYQILTSVQKVQKRYDFIDLPDEFTNSLTPEIRVYKTYISSDGKEYNYLLPMGSYLGRRGDAVDNVQGVVVKSAEFTRLGGNPAEIDTNIKFNLKLFAKDINTFFIKNESKPIENFVWTTPPNYAYNAARADAISDTISSLETQLSQATAENQAGIQQRIDDKTIILERINDRLSALAQAVEDVAEDGTRRTSWIDLIKINPGQPLEENVSNELVTSEEQVRIRVEIGYAEVNNKPINYSKDDWREWTEAIGKQEEVFYLSLLKHQFEFNGYDGVELSIDFVASGEAKQLSPAADMFNNIELRNNLRRLQKERREKKKQVKLAHQQSDEDITTITTDCVSNLETAIEDFDNEIKAKSAQISLQLLNQIYLEPSNNSTAVMHFSRLYIRQYIPVGDNDVQTDITYARAISAEGQTHGLTLRTGDAHLSSIDFLASTNTSEARNDESVTRTFVEGGRLGDKFIFLGDIIDAAAEILFPADRINQTREFSTMRSSRHGYIGTHKMQRHFYHATYVVPLVYQGQAAAADAAAFRVKAALSQLGGFLLGKVKYTNPNNVEQDIQIPIRDIPIALDIFRAWWIRKFVKTQRKSLVFKDFIVELLRFVEKDVFSEIPLEHGTNEDKIETPRFIVNTIAVDSLTDIYANIYSSASSGWATKFNNVGEDVLQASVDEGEKRGDTQEYLSVIEQVNSGIRYNPSVHPTLVFGETSKGILKKIDFEREDIPGHAEARLFSDRTSVAGNIALREKYNTSLELLGTTAFLPGSVLYIDPLPLDLGFSSTERNSLARSLGLGGMYSVSDLTSTLSFDSSGNTWNTKVRTKWVSFGDASDGVSAATTPSSESLGMCAEEEEAAATASAALSAAVAENRRNQEISQAGVRTDVAGSSQHRTQSTAAGTVSE